MISELIGNLNRDAAIELGTALKFAADILANQSNHGTAALVVRDLQHTLNDVALRNGWRTPADGSIVQPLAETLAELDRETLTLLMSTLAVVKKNWPMPPEVTAVFDELNLAVQAGRIAGGHALGYADERAIEKLLAGDQAA